MDAIRELGLDSEILLTALADEAATAHCQTCGVSEFVVPLEGTLDANFLANYRCDDCDGLDLLSSDAAQVEEKGHPR
jgi:hypothetical protein